MRLTTKTLLLLILLTGLAVLAGCAGQAEMPGQEPVITDVQSYFPTEPSLTWTYEGSGNEYAGFTRTVIYREGNQVQMAENNGGTRLGRVYQVSAEAITQTLSREEYYSNDSLLNEKPHQRQILLKAPLKVGQVWEDMQNKREIVSINESVQLPAGTFQHVVKVKITSLDPQQKDHLQFEYYAPDAGLIMREFRGDNYVVTSKLQSLQRMAAAE